MRLQHYNHRAKEKMQLALIQHCPLCAQSYHGLFDIMILSGGGSLWFSTTWSRRWGRARPKGESTFERRTQSVSRGLP
jgi:hypothetical protein